MFKRLLILFLLLLDTAPAFAQTDSISTALGVVDDFYRASSFEVKGSGLAQLAGDSLNASIEEKEQVKKDLRSFGLAEAPGPERGRMIYKTVESYMEDVIESIKDIQAPSEEDQGRIDKAVNRLSELRETKLDDLSAAIRKEEVRRRRHKRVPVIENSPLVTSPDQAEGIWVR